MAKDYGAMPPTAMRRNDRAVEDEAWIKQFLHEEPFGVLATEHAGQPFINSNLFVYDEPRHCLYMHTARVGRTAANVGAEGTAVCFSVSRMGRLLPAEVALEFSVEYAGVVVFGQAQIITAAEAATRALQLLLDKYFPHLQPGADYRAITAEELRRTSVYQIDIEAWSGKRKQVAADFAGAFHYNERASLIEAS